MNYLAHLFLAKNTINSRIGNLMGDFLHGSANDLINEEVIQGINTHRKVDKYTDLHKDVKICNRVITNSGYKYSGIIVDVLFDYFLSIHWNIYSKYKKNSFIKDLYESLSSYKGYLPKRMEIVLPLLIREDWLSSYGTIEGINNTLNRISLRLKKQKALKGSIKVLKNNYKILENHFLSFFSQLLEEVNSWNNE